MVWILKLFNWENKLIVKEAVNKTNEVKMVIKKYLHRDPSYVKFAKQQHVKGLG